ncbi:MAG: hypothetical protein M1370_07725 [Bacteroidetes bacterium]|nr:hypothetical protein [Bacteroidota bacterium]MCL5026268.1 hypothetical protein [Chloroflexota bacterium]
MRPHRRGESGWLIISAVVFVSILLLGVLLASTLPPIVDPLMRDAPTDETIVLIAYLYDREGVLNNARDRLALLGEKGSDQVVDDLASNYPKTHPDQPREAQSLGRLAKDLGLSKPAGRPSGQGSKDDLGWLGTTLLVVFLLLMVGSFMASVTRGRWSTAFAGLGQGARRLRPPAEPIDDSMGRASAPPAEPIEEPTPARWLEAPKQWWSRLTSSRQSARRRERSMTARRPASYEADIEPSPRPWGVEPPPEPVAEPGRLLLSFQSTYRAGQDPYQEVYPILEDQTAVLIGACGLSPGLASDPSRPERYHTMVVWLHDYRNPHVLRNTVLVSRGLYYDRPQDLEDWLNSQPIQAALPAEPGRSMTLEGAALRARVSVLEVETEPMSNPSGPIAWLVLRFDITLKQPTPRVSAGI